MTEEKALACYAAWGKYNLVLQELSYTSKSKRTQILQNDKMMTNITYICNRYKVNLVY